jgi:hypothetical protein
MLDSPLREALMFPSKAAGGKPWLIRMIDCRTKINSDINSDRILCMS